MGHLSSPRGHRGSATFRCVTAIRKMPPVASDVAPTLGEVLNELLDRGVGGITSARQLAIRLAEIKNTTVEGERRSIRRHIRYGNAEEASIVAYAEAFGVARSVFPEATGRRPRTYASAKELEVLREEVATLRDQLDGVMRRLPDPGEPEAGTP